MTEAEYLVILIQAKEAVTMQSEIIRRQELEIARWVARYEEIVELYTGAFESYVRNKETVEAIAENNTRLNQAVKRNLH